MSKRPAKKISLEQLVYECDGCGLCCKRLIVEASHLDAIREPRIAAETYLLDGQGTLAFAETAFDMQQHKSGARNRDRACVFFGPDSRCGIYATRPNTCVEFQPGNEKCRDLRETYGKPPLKAKRVAQPSLSERLHVLARDDGDDE